MTNTQTIAHVVLPATPLTAQAIEYVRRSCESYLFNHVMRSWLFAVRLGQLQGIGHGTEVLAVGTLLHDITLNERFAGPHRFEVEAADLAQDFARRGGLDDRRAQLV
jgi:HD superfamily phosphodiesterase